LGVAVLTPLELLNAMSTFANNGIRVDDYAVERVEDQNGRVIEQHISKEKEAFSPQNSFILINMMKGVVERGTGGAARALKRPLAGKTGTSQNYRDTWFTGMTPELAAAAWMGYDDDTFQESGRWTGGGTVAYWWTDIMREVLKDEPVSDFAVPEGISFAFVNPDTGKLASPADRKKIMEAFIRGTEPSSF
jgi:penicillin-binding protein 1A